MEQDLIDFIEEKTGFRRHPITDAIRDYFKQINREKTEEKIRQIRENLEEINRLIG